jgi:hypothetical protein
MSRASGVVVAFVMPDSSWMIGFLPLRARLRDDDEEAEATMAKTTMTDGRNLDGRQHKNA